jgi:hypothetical protein
MTEEQNRAALLRAALEAVAAKEAAKKTSVSAGRETPPQTSPKTQADLSPELRILAQRRARFDGGDRSVHREIFGRQEQTVARNVDFPLF